MKEICDLTFNKLNEVLMDMDLDEVKRLLNYAKRNKIPPYKLKRIHQRYVRLKSRNEREELF